MEIRATNTTIARRENFASCFHRPGFVQVLFVFLLISAAAVPVRAATLNQGFGPLSLVKGARPVPGGCGRPMAACTCCAQEEGTNMGTDVNMNMGMGMGGVIVDYNVRLDVIGLDASPNQLTVVNVGTSAYSINGVSNPILTFVRGQTYTFNVTASGHPFYIKTVQGNGTGNAYTNGVTGNGTQTGAVTFTVPLDAPNTLFYDCAIHAPMTNRIDVINAVPEPSTWALLSVTVVGASLALRRQRALV